MALIMRSMFRSAKLQMPRIIALCAARAAMQAISVEATGRCSPRTLRLPPSSPVPCTVGSWGPIIIGYI